MANKNNCQEAQASDSRDEQRDLRADRKANLEKSGSEPEQIADSNCRSIAIISDVHANAHNLITVFRKIDAMEIKDVFCLGDFASGGEYPKICFELITERCSIILKGNHELFVTDRVWDSSTSEWAWLAKAADLELGSSRVSVLRSLPYQVDGSAMQLVHASLRDPIWEFISTAATAAKQFPLQTADYTFYGHTHTPALWAYDENNGASRIRISQDWIDLPKRALINPGAVMDPRGARWLEVKLNAKGRPEVVRWHREPN